VSCASTPRGMVRDELDTLLSYDDRLLAAAKSPRHPDGQPGVTGPGCDRATCGPRRTAATDTHNSPAAVPKAAG
jgi:hypothetical protein